MKIVYAVFFSCVCSVAAVAQKNTSSRIIPDAPISQKTTYVEAQRSQPVSGADRVTLWSDDFSNPANWIIAHSGDFNADFEIGVGLESGGPYATPAILSTTAGNGYAMYNSDGFGNEAGVAYEQPHITTANPINLADNPNVVLEFETQYRRFNNEQTYLIVSTDGTFPELTDPTADISTFPGVIKVWEEGELSQGVSPGNPTVRSFNISEIAGNAPQVWVRLQFTGIWGYAWYIDDIKIYEQFQHDAKIFNAYVSSTGTGEEYGRILQTQMPTEMNVGCMVKNLGYEAMSNVTVSIDYNGSISTYSQAELLPGDTMFVDDYIAVTNALGQYNVNYSVTSDNSDGDANNDTDVRYYEVSETEFSMDAIEIHPTGTASLGSYGTNSYADNADEFMMFTYFPISQTETFNCVKIQLANGSVAGAEVIVAVHDTLSILSDVLDSPLGGSDSYIISQTDIDNGFAAVPLTDPLTLDPEAYYVSVACYSSENAYDVRVLDDLTVPQPNNASLIFLPADGGVYGNGNAFAIRLSTEICIDVNEVAGAKELQGITVYPNPVGGGIINIAAKQRENYTVEIFDAAGKMVESKNFQMTSAIDVEHLAKGVYTLRVRTADAASTQLVTIH